MPKNHACTNCGAHGMEVFYEVEGIPVHSVQLLKTRQEALDYPKGDIALAFCRGCGFVANVAFDPKLHDYSHEYESTQHYSGTFNAFHKQLADGLDDQECPQPALGLLAGRLALLLDLDILTLLAQFFDLEAHLGDERERTLEALRRRVGLRIVRSGTVGVWAGFFVVCAGHLKSELALV